MSLEYSVSGSRLINRNITATAGRTSMRLEPEVWDALREICLREGLELRDLIQKVEQGAGEGGRTSAVRVHVLQYFRAAASEEGHRKAGHGQVNMANNVDGVAALGRRLNT
jgi:predicted DNA-binding ribbon-helix-helix protein